MDYLILVIIAVIVIVTIVTVIEYKIKYKDEEEEELTEQEKTMRALRILIYIILGLIITGVAFKLLLLYGILNF